MLLSFRKAPLHNGVLVVRKSWRSRPKVVTSLVVGVLAIAVGIGSFLMPEAHAYTANAFVMVVKTDNPGTSNATSFTIPITGAGYSYNVDCNDDGINEVTARTTSYTCVYGAAGTYTIAITGTFPRIYFNNGGDRQKLLEVKQWGTGAWTSMASAFYGCNNLHVTATDAPNLAGVTSLAAMFRNATSMNENINHWNTSTITSLAQTFYGATAYNQPLDNWNTSNTTSLSEAFYGATVFNQPIGSWDTANVTSFYRTFRGAAAFNESLTAWNTSAATTMVEMFYGATAFNQDMANWNTSNVASMKNMFVDAKVFNGDISGWNTAKVVDMSYMFLRARAFNSPIGAWDTGAVTTMFAMFNGATNFNQPIGMWDVSSVTNMQQMFSSATSFNQPLDTWQITSLLTMREMFRNAIAFNQPLNSWNTSTVQNMGYAFHSTAAFNQPLDAWDTSMVTVMDQMFYNTSSFNQPIGNWDVSKVINMRQMFGSATAFNQPLNAWNTGAVTNMSTMFAGATAFDQPIGNWSTGSVTDMSCMFCSATAFNQPIGTWDVSKVTNMASMFSSATAFNQPLTGWNTSAVTNMSYMFFGTLFNQPIDTWITSNVTNMSNMFGNNSVFNQPLNSWDTSKVTDMNRMFGVNPGTGSSFNQPLDGWDTSAVTNMSLMFSGATAFNQPLTGWNTSAVTNMSYMFSGASAFNQPLTNFNTSAVTSMSGMFDYSGFSTANYDQTLAGWASQTLQPNVTLGAAGVVYCNDTARATLTSAPNNWTITDGGYCPPTITSPTNLQVLATTTPTISGSVAPSRTVHIQLDGTDFTTNASADGSYSYTVASALSEGWHTVVLRSTDITGTPGVPTSISFYIHTATPYQVTDPIPVVTSLTGKLVIHPVTGAPSTVTMAPALANAALSIASYDCSDLQIPTVRLVEPDGLKVTEADITLLGGVGFSVGCTSTGKSTDVSLALGAHYNDTSKLRAYKQSGTSLVDITKQVTFTNKDVGGTTKTVVSYNLVDGGNLDEDGMANGTLVDPLFIGVVDGADGSLANTGFNVYVLVALAVALLAGACALWRKGLKAPKRVSFR